MSLKYCPRCYTVYYVDGEAEVGCQCGVGIIAVPPPTPKIKGSPYDAGRGWERGV